MTPEAGRGTSHTTGPGAEGPGSVGKSRGGVGSPRPSGTRAPIRLRLQRLRLQLRAEGGGGSWTHPPSHPASGSGPGDQQAPFHGPQPTPDCAHLPAGLLRPSMPSRPHGSLPPAPSSPSSPTGAPHPVNKPKKDAVILEGPPLRSHALQRDCGTGCRPIRGVLETHQGPSAQALPRKKPAARPLDRHVHEPQNTSGGGMLAVGGVQTPPRPVPGLTAEGKKQVRSIFPPAPWHEVWVHSGPGVLSRHSHWASAEPSAWGTPSPQAVGNEL